MLKPEQQAIVLFVSPQVCRILLPFTEEVLVEWSFSQLSSYLMAVGGVVTLTVARTRLSEPNWEMIRAQVWVLLAAWMLFAELLFVAGRKDVRLCGVESASAQGYLRRVGAVLAREQGPSRSFVSGSGHQRRISEWSSIPRLVAQGKKLESLIFVFFFKKKNFSQGQRKSLGFSRSPLEDTLPPRAAKDDTSLPKSADSGLTLPRMEPKKGRCCCCCCWRCCLLRCACAPKVGTFSFFQRKSISKVDAPTTPTNKTAK
jgi:hypothetical protein